MGYYKPCAELDRRNELIEKYFKTQRYAECFQGHLPPALEKCRELGISID